MLISTSGSIIRRPLDSPPSDSQASRSSSSSGNDKRQERERRQLLERIRLKDEVEALRSQVDIWQRLLEYQDSEIRRLEAEKKLLVSHVQRQRNIIQNALRLEVGQASDLAAILESPTRQGITPPEDEAAGQPSDKQPHHTHRHALQQEQHDMADGEGEGEDGDSDATKRVRYHDLLEENLSLQREALSILSRLNGRSPSSDGSPPALTQFIRGITFIEASPNVTDVEEENLVNRSPPREMPTTRSTETANMDEAATAKEGSVQEVTRAGKFRIVRRDDGRHGRAACSEREAALAKLGSWLEKTRLSGISLRRKGRRRSEGE
ncbi:unnamed protein product [Vitrella brassicaformis CCMP3155]|uniref:Uncharacterized protein n=2 Tax=Vitrella brassicaformis TaxID=1169539 RepID=A0A0G4EMK1_VITBC|nr:unnamed protein product [Vitrella brassicaformis CCMP3155]|mmetsp:Transcript_23678/g.58544  ORF Transcript_23678/g.58544 Transcript_23678/m.58544 type:complete len:322 (+) Transcript_23678:26-991(+)|eukprot:CEL98404.1 unnamed protein product [Vitrella brassicaformis CCMP3155]